MLMRQEDREINEISKTWSESACDFAVGQGIGEIRGIAAALNAEGKESVANELLDAVRYIECGYLRQRAQTEVSSESEAERARWPKTQEALSKAISNLSFDAGYDTENSFQKKK